MHKILVADDDEGILSALTMLLKSEGYKATVVTSPAAALSELGNQDFSLVLIDLNYSTDTTSGDEGMQLINGIRKVDELVPIVVMTGWGTIEVAVNTMQCGANDFIQKPWENERLLAIIQNQLKLANAQKHSEKLSEQNKLLRQEYSPDYSIVGESNAVRKVIETIRQLAQSDVSVLMTGENGTGKSMFARYLHETSPRSASDLISVNMGAVTETLFESEMFGHVKGAFTDAKSSRIGRFELADKGSLFLDEIANTPKSQQAKLLRVLEDSQFEKVGSSKTQSIDIRLITATNTDLRQAVSDGEFRKDLLYRINTVEIRIPSLRERIEDIIPLAQVFLQRAAEKYSQPVLKIGVAAELALKSYPWPGNVRELGHVMERAQILCQGAEIAASDLSLGNSVTEISPAGSQHGSEDLRTLSEIEVDIIDKRYAHFKGDALKTAKSLGLSRSAFYRRLEKQ